MAVPYQNSQFSGLGITPSKSMVVNSGTITATVYYEVSGSRTTTSPSVSIHQETSLTYIRVLLGNSVDIPNGAVLTVVFNELLMPPSLAPLSGVSVFSGDTDYY